MVSSVCLKVLRTMIKTGGKLIGKNKSGVEVYNVGENTLASFKNGELFKVIVKDAGKKKSTIFDFNRQLIINTKRSNEKCGGISKEFVHMDTDETLAKLKIFYDKRGIAKVSASTPEGDMFGLTYFNNLCRKFNCHMNGRRQTKGYIVGLREFFAEFRTRITKNPEIKPVPDVVSKSEPVFVDITELLEKTQSKIKSYAANVHEKSKLTKPVIMEKDGVQIGFFIDKTNPGGTRITLKSGTNLSDWGNDQNVEILYAVVNKKGQMVEGTLSGRGGTFNFSRNEKNVRRIEIGGQVFIPVGNASKSWSCKSDGKGQIHALENSIVNNESFGNLFLTWAELKSTIF